MRSGNGVLFHVLRDQRVDTRRPAGEHAGVAGHKRHSGPDSVGPLHRRKRHCSVNAGDGEQEDDYSIVRVL